MKKLLLILGVVLLCGCTASYEDKTDTFSLPPELQDYKVVRLDTSSLGTILYVLVKKNGEDRNVIGTTSPQGKFLVHTIVIDEKTVAIDGVTYNKLEK